MKQLKYELSFATPAFLGNAEQQAQWRTPPIKTLLRQWWRVAYAADHGFKVDLCTMRREEGLLFGHAWLKEDFYERGGRQFATAARKSQVRLRLEQPNGDNVHAWTTGSQKGVTPLSGGLETSYAWFGLIKRGDGQPDRTAIKAVGNEKALSAEAIRRLHVAVPDGVVSKFEEIMRLIDAFGLLGSRSRGGWGALHIDGINPMPYAEMSHYARSLDECLNHDWAMSLARNADQLCVWHSNSTFKEWHKAMEVVATERRRVRSALKGVKGKDLRPAIGFAAQSRMPSPLRWKIIPNENGSLLIRVFALPHQLPLDSGKFMRTEELNQAWEIVCGILDQSQHVTRLN